MAVETLVRFSNWSPCCCGNLSSIVRFDHHLVVESQDAQTARSGRGAGDGGEQTASRNDDYTKMCLVYIGLETRDSGTALHQT